LGASRGYGDKNKPIFDAAQVASKHVVSSIWVTNHAFSDKRVALAEALVGWLQALP
jgi:hypothetical protein